MAVNYPHPILAREGWPFIAASVAAAVAVWAFAGFGWSVPVWIVVAFVVQFFRDPARVIPQEAGLVLCPADGRIASGGANAGVEARNAGAPCNTWNCVCSMIAWCAKGPPVSRWRSPRT